MRGEPATEDFRVRVAAERRERMRARLLDALLALHAPGAEVGALLIDDVIRAAGVSRGSFYKYFGTVEEAAIALGEQLTAALIADFEVLFGAEPDPAARAIGGVVMTIARAAADPRWAAFTSKVDYVDFFVRHAAFDLMVRDCLAAARAGGTMRFVSLDAAVDLILGATIEARRRMVRGLDDPCAYADELATRLFIGLGMPEPEVTSRLAAVRQRIDNVRRGAPGEVPAERQGPARGKLSVGGA